MFLRGLGSVFPFVVMLVIGHPFALGKGAVLAQDGYRILPSKAQGTVVSMTC